jgi:proline dehydrogenase
LAHATSNDYSFGAKLVRGAYVESERKRHEQALTATCSTEEESGPCIVWNSKEETDNCYDQCATILEKRIVQDLKEEDRQQQERDEGNNNKQVESSKKKKSQVGVCLASHNGTSMKKFLGNLRNDGLVKVGGDGRLQVDDRLRGRVAFGQLMGTLSLSLSLSE